MFETFSGAQGLRDESQHRRQSVFHPMVKLFEQDALQPIETLLLGGINSCLGEEAAQIEVLVLKPEFFLVTQI
jgi:hypothetical protein